MFSSLFSPPNFHYVKPVLWTWRKMTFILWEHDLQRVNFLLCEQITKKKTSLVIKAHFFLCSESWFHHVNESSGRLLSSSTNQEKRLECICCCSVLHLAFAQTHAVQDSPCTVCTAACFPDVLITKRHCWSRTGTSFPPSQPRALSSESQLYACSLSLAYWTFTHFLKSVRPKASRKKHRLAADINRYNSKRTMKELHERRA